MNKQEEPPGKVKLDVKSKPRMWDETFQLMSWWDSESVQKARIMVVGAGALGNEVLKNLALLNVGQILIVDFDEIEYANLSRSILYRESDVGKHQLKSEVAARRIREINPNVKVMTIAADIGVDVGLGVFRRMDCVIGCLDNRLARLMINRNCFLVGKTWIDGAIENLAGQLNVYQMGKACYECQLSESEWANIRFKLGCPDIARRNETLGKIPTTPLSASIIGAMQVQEALKIIHGNEGQSLAGQGFKYEGMHNMIIIYDAPALKEECGSHYTIENLVEAPELTSGSTVGETLAWLKEKLGTDDPVVQLDNEVVLELTSRESERTHEVMVAKPHLGDEILLKLQEVPGEEIMITRSVQAIDSSSRQDLALSAFGIPPLHILQVETEDDIHFVELTGDEKYVTFA